MASNQQVSQELLHWLEHSIGFEFFGPGVERNLERIKTLFHPWVNPLNQGCLVVTIGGTNGKGQVSMQLAQMLKVKGLRYCLWTSPHISCVSERFQTEQGSVDPGSLLARFKALKKHLDQAEVGLSYYEFLFACFLQWANEIKPEVLILEVGLGGRLDAVNFFDAHIAAITSISRDHQQILGHRYEQILKEKLGITRREQSFFSNLSLDYLKQMIIKHIPAGIDWQDLTQTKAYKQAKGYWEQNLLLACSLAKEVLKRFQFESTDAALAGSVSKALPLRREWIRYQEHDYCLIGAHNVDGFRHTFLQPSLGSEETRPHCLLLAFSQREVKDLEQMLLILHRGIQRWQREQGNSENGYPPLEILLCNWEHFKAYPAQNVLKLYEGLKNRGYYANDSVSWKVQADWREGIKQISSRSNQQKVLAIGSLYFLGQVRDYLIGTAGLHPD